MFSDERMGDDFLPALARLPKGAGLVFRHYSLAPKARRALFLRAMEIARARRIVVILAGTAQQAAAWRADGVHGRRQHKRQNVRCHLRTAPVHNRRELIAAQRNGADLIFVSPVFATRSHPNTRVLGRRGFAAFARHSAVPVIALGGMTARRARTLPHTHGWAAIDAWLPTHADTAMRLG